MKQVSISDRNPSDERIDKRLRRLYESFGFQPYRMSKFEEYDLYLTNKDFLGESSILTFTDTNGKLMALKPDVTLSIVKNLRRGKGVQKVFYNENVYRVSRNSGTYREIPQSGLECIGDIGRYELTEALYLALKSLELTERRYRLDISHMGLLSPLVEASVSDGEEREELMNCIRRKNSDGILELFDRIGADPQIAKVLAKASSLYGTPDEVLPKLSALLGEAAKDALDELASLCDSLKALGYGDTLGIDLSIMNDMSYYRSLLFRGYVDGIPDGVLVGGCYDSLMKKMGRDCGAIGFAVSLERLEHLRTAKAPSDPEVVILYDKSLSPELVLSALQKEIAAGKRAVAVKELPETSSSAVIKRLASDGALVDVK